MTKQQRLDEYYNRLRRQPPSTTAEEALDRLEQTLIEVEDELSGIPRSDPPPPPRMPDGRMYPPQEDNITRNPAGSITAYTKHAISLRLARMGTSLSATCQRARLNSNSPEEESDMSICEDAAGLADELQKGPLSCRD